MTDLKQEQRQPILDVLALDLLMVTHSEQPLMAQQMLTLNQLLENVPLIQYFNSQHKKAQSMHRVQLVKHKAMQVMHGFIEMVTSTTLTKKSH